MLVQLASKIESFLVSQISFSLMIVVNAWKESHEKQSPISLTICTDFCSSRK